MQSVQKPVGVELQGGLRRRPDGDVEIPVRRPDGDVELQDAGHGFVVPPCTVCGGVLKPDVVFFGDSIPPSRSRRSGPPSQAPAALLLLRSCAVDLYLTDPYHPTLQPQIRPPSQALQYHRRHAVPGVFNDVAP